MIAYFVQQPIDYILSPYKPIQYKVIAEVPFSNAIRFIVKVFVNSEPEPVVEFENIGKPQGSSFTSYNFELQRILKELVPNAKKPNISEELQIDYNAVIDYYVQVIVTDKANNETETVTSQTNRTWQGISNNPEQRLLISSRKRLVNRGEINYISYLIQETTPNFVVLLNGLEIFNVEIYDACIITIPFVITQKSTIEIREIDGGEIVRNAFCEFDIHQECLVQYLFQNTYGGWETFYFKEYSQAEASIQNEEITNISEIYLPENRIKKSVFREIIETYKVNSRSIQEFEKPTLRNLFESKDAYILQKGEHLPIIITGDNYILYMRRKLLFLAFTFVFATACNPNLESPLNINSPIILCGYADNEKFSVAYNPNGLQPLDTIVTKFTNLETGENFITQKPRGTGSKSISTALSTNGANGSKGILEIYAKRGDETSNSQRLEITVAPYDRVPYPSEFTIVGSGVNLGGNWLTIIWNANSNNCLAHPDDYMSAKIQIWRSGMPQRIYTFISQTGYPYELGTREQGNIGVMQRNISLETGQASFTIQNGDQVRLLIKTSRNDKTTEESDYKYVTQNVFFISGL